MSDDSGPVVIEPKNVNDLKKLARIFSRTGRSNRKLETRWADRVGRIQAFYEAKLANSKALYEKASQAMLTFALEHQELFPKGKKTMALGSATISLRDSEELEIDDEPKLVETLELLGHNDMIETKKSVRRSVLKKNTELIKQLPGVRFRTNVTATVIATPSTRELLSKDEPIKETLKKAMDTN
jgi:phage host-nuclease inhibitor protein Gam